MDRINGSNVAPDLHGAGKDGWRDGNKALGIPATVVTAEFLNSLQEEVANVIEGQGITLDVGDKTQLKQAIELMVKGGDYKASVRVASTAAINLAAPGANIDGVAMVAGNRFLEKDNATLANRGIYIWNGAAVAATRALDADTGAEFNGGAIIPVEEGTVNADTNWQVTNDGTVTIGVTGLTFKLVGASKAISAIQGSFRNLKGSSTGTSAVVTYTLDELVTGDGAGEYLTTRNWNSTITMTTAGAGGLDTGGVAASTWYYAYGITKDDGTKALIASLSSAAPTLPVGYTKWARIGSFRTDGTANKYPLRFGQAGRFVDYRPASGSNLTAFPTLATGAAATWTAIGISNVMPPTAGRIKININNLAVSSSIGIATNVNEVTSTGASMWTNNTTAGGSSGSVSYITPESTNIYWMAAGNSVAYCQGWEDNI